MSDQNISQVHFVGSACLPDTTSTMRYLATSFRPAELKTIPDGEPGKRGNFVVFQLDVFGDIPHVTQMPGASPQSNAEEILPGPDAPPIKLRPVAYDHYAVESYAEFRKLREQGVIPMGTRFQVSLPTPTNVLGNLIRPTWRSAIEPVYTQALLQALQRIQEAIPPEDLAIQWDMAGEFAYLEGAASTPPWFEGPVQDGLLARAKEMIEATSPKVLLGLHLCYGDFGHKHFAEPQNLEHIVTFANVLMRSTNRRIDWIHMPVPKARSDDAYFAPLARLEAPETTTVFLGLLHLNDTAGTNQKIQTAKRIAPARKFGISTECGLGRSSNEELESAVRIAHQVLRES